jgi:putative ABC transport system permease protein
MSAIPPSGSLRRAVAHLRLRPSRLVGTLLSVVIGIGFACAAVVFTATYHEDLAARVSVSYARADVVVTPTSDRPATQLAADVATVPGVAAAVPLYQVGVPFAGPSSHGYLDLAVVPDATALRWMTLTRGAWPTGADQIAVTAGAASAFHLPVGTAVRLTTADDTARAATVVGIVDPAGPTPFSVQSLGFGAPAMFSGLGSDTASLIAVRADTGVSPSALAIAVGDRLGADGTARTAGEQARVDLAGLAGHIDPITVVLLGFATVALTVAGLVIANTVSILLAQRRRQIALLRCIGATRRQVRGEILGEMAIVGGAGSSCGAVVGSAVGVLAARLTDLDSGGLAIPVLPLAIAVLVGIALTVIAGVVPIWRVTTVPPLAALRPDNPTDLTPRPRHARAVGGLVVEVGGLALLLAGVRSGTLEMALLGGMVSAVGVLVLTRTVLPVLLRGLAVPARRWGIAGALAAANARRNPGRSAAASAALIVGVGLIVMLQVAAATAGASTDRALDQRYPVDIAVDTSATALPATLPAAVGRVAGVARSVAIRGVPARLDPSIAGDIDLRLVGLTTDAGAVVRGGLEALHPTTGGLPVVEVPGWLIGGDLQPGSELSVTVGGRPHRFTVASGHLGDALSSGPALVTTADALRAIAPDAPVIAVWASSTAGADPAAVTAALTSLVNPYPEVRVGGSAADRASMHAVLGTATQVATGLLAVAVVIAIMGIGTTIGLSVVERTRESALLRALGLRRGQLRVSLALEAVLLATLGAGVGVVLGIGYGWAGAATTFRTVGRTLVLDIPWGSVALVLAVAVVAGGLASVLPGRRAARARPVEALAED